MADGGWRMADGGWRMADGGWRMADDKIVFTVVKFRAKCEVTKTKLSKPHLAENRKVSSCGRFVYPFFSIIIWISRSLRSGSSRVMKVGEERVRSNPTIFD